MKFNLITVFTIKENVKNNTAENTFIALHSIKSFYRNKNFLSYFFLKLDIKMYSLSCIVLIISVAMTTTMKITGVERIINDFDSVS